MITVNVGEPFPIALGERPGAYWDGDSLLILVVPSFDEEMLQVLAEGELQLGVYSDGPFRNVVLRISQGGRVYATWSLHLAWWAGDPPEVAACDDERILWKLVVCSTGDDSQWAGARSVGDPLVSSFRVFTTSPEVTRALRRLTAEQRAAGRLTDEEYAIAHAALLLSGETEDHWSRCVAYSWAGE